MKNKLKAEQNNKSETDLQQQIIDLQNKYNFQLSQCNYLKQQNKQLRHELNVIQSLDIQIFSQYNRSVNILMQLILSPIHLCHKLTSEDWQQLFKCIDILYSKKIKSQLINYNCLSDEEIGLWYFCLIGIENTNLAIFFGISVSSLYKRKQRLNNKLLYLLL